MKIEITCDERYPVYSFESASPGRPSVEVLDEIVARWREAERAFDSAQDEMRQAAEGAK